MPETKPLEIFEAKCACDCECTRCTTVRGDDPVCETYELWLAPRDVKKTWDALVAHAATPIGSEALEMHRILNGIPLFGVDICDRDLPQETEQTRALNFNKGCYIGQEIVERIRSRGAVHRKFAGFVADAGKPISSGSKIVASDKEVGEVTSVVCLRMPNPEKTVALGYIRREVGTPGRDVMIGGFRATIVPLPVPDSTLEAQAPSVAGPA
jgi:aminomethyltransferase